MRQEAPEAVQIPDDINAFAQQQYREQTAYMKVIEAILIDRPGYKPRQIDESL